MNLYCVCVSRHTRGDEEDSLQESVLSFHRVGSREWTQGVRLGCSHLLATKPSHWPSRSCNSVLCSSGARCQCKQWNSCDEPRYRDTRKRLIQFVVFQMHAVTTDGLSPEVHQQLHSKKQSFVWELWSWWKLPLTAPVINSCLRKMWVHKAGIWNIFVVELVGTKLQIMEGCPKTTRWNS